MKKLRLLLLATGLFFVQQNGFSQIIKKAVVEASCGQQIDLEFNESKESQPIKIDLKAGDKLHFKVTPTGDYLNLRAEIYDSANGKLYPLKGYKEPMFTEGTRTLDVTTGKLSSTGTYTIIIYNNYKSYKKDARAGEYTFTATCNK